MTDAALEQVSENQLTFGLDVNMTFGGGIRMSLGNRITFGDGAHSHNPVLRIGLHRTFPMR